MITEEKVREMAPGLAERFKPDKVILFGSCARSRLGPDSDVEFLVALRFSGS